MYPVKIEWIPAVKGGKKLIPSEGKYYPVSRFPEDKEWPSNAWSVVFDLEKQKSEGGLIISFGTVDFLMDEAPKERMKKNDSFEIYEGSQKVATVFLLHK